MISDEQNKRAPLESQGADDDVSRPDTARTGHEQELALSAEAMERLMRDRFERPMPRRFYETVSVSEKGPPFAILLDERPVKTPQKHPLALPTQALAEAVAEEWRAQEERIRPFTMPLTRLCNAAIDRLPQQKDETIAHLLELAAHDMLCYRADHPAELAARQQELWDPILAWAEKTLAGPLCITAGILPVTQPPETLTALEQRLERLDPYALVAVAAMADLTRSALLALAVLAGAITPEHAWAAANVEEDWNIAQWGEDMEAAARRRQNARDFFAAARLPALAGSAVAL